MGILFFGSIATTSVATTLQVSNLSSIVDNDKDKDKKKAKASESKEKENKMEKSCCSSTKMMNEKSSECSKKEGGDKK